MDLGLGGLPRLRAVQMKRPKQRRARPRTVKAAVIDDFNQSGLRKVIVWLVAFKILGLILFISPAGYDAFQEPKSTLSRVIECVLIGALALSLARYGLAVHTTAPHIDAAFVGQIALELYNLGPLPIELRPGIDRVCHLIFHEMKSAVPESVAKSMGTFVRQKEPYQKPRSTHKSPHTV